MSKNYNLGTLVQMFIAKKNFGCKFLLLIQMVFFYIYIFQVKTSSVQMFNNPGTNVKFDNPCTYFKFWNPCTNFRFFFGGGGMAWPL